MFGITCETSTFAQRAREIKVERVVVALIKVRRGN